MNRKGFPDSYDRARLVRFLADVKAGAPEAHAPEISHQRYDIVPDAVLTVRQPDIAIVEGLNVLQAPEERAESTVFRRLTSSTSRFTLMPTKWTSSVGPWSASFACATRSSRIRSRISTATPRSTKRKPDRLRRASGETINGVNLRENIAPTCARAHPHSSQVQRNAVQQVLLRVVSAAPVTLI